MRPKTRKFAFRKVLPPLAAFVAAAALHIGWAWLTGREPLVQSRWTPGAGNPEGWWAAYVASGEYWMAYLYGLSAAFVTAALRNFLRARREARAGAVEGGMAAGGVTFAGVLAAAGCFLVGCCGSPMLVVWVSLLGANAAPLAKPIIALGSTLLMGMAWWWMARRDRFCSC